MFWSHLIIGTIELSRVSIQHGYNENLLFCCKTPVKNRFKVKGHGRNRLVDNTWQQQNRTFFSFPKQSRNREYRGRQLVGYTMEQMYEVVADVENYHKFVPWCKQSLVKQKSSNRLVGELIVGFPPINESYTSIVTLVKPHLVKAECTDGRLFEHLITVWRFSPGLKKEQQSCVVDFHIDFEFRSVFHSQISNLFFDQVAKKMEGAFIAEVGNRFGTATMPPRNLLI